MDIAKRASSFLILALMGASLAACATQQAGIGVAQYEAATPAYEEQQFFFLGGMFQTKIIPAAGICGGADRVGRVEALAAPVDIVIGVLTLGIIYPRTARVYCEGG